MRYENPFFILHDTAGECVVKILIPELIQTSSSEFQGSISDHWLNRSEG